MITIDWFTGEGGGQILLQASALTFFEKSDDKSAPAHT
jgi:hypothetical protein